MSLSSVVCEEVALVGLGSLSCCDGVYMCVESFVIGEGFIQNTLEELPNNKIKTLRKVTKCDRNINTM